jgi:hypothetical protein
MSLDTTPDSRGVFSLKSFSEILKIEAEAMVSRLEELTSQTDAEHAFLSFALLQIMTISKAGGIIEEHEHGTLPAQIETAAFHLYPRFGLASVIDPDAVQEIIDKVPEVLRRNLMLAGGESFHEGLPTNVIGPSKMYAIAVRGSAWPDQTKAEIRGIQSNFDTWFEKKIGLSPSRALYILESMEKSFSEKMEKAQADLFLDIEGMPDPLENHERAREIFEAKMRSFTETLPRCMPLDRTDLKTDPVVSEVEWSTLINLIGLTPMKRSEMTLPAEVSTCPLFVIGGDRAFFVDESTVLDAIYEAFDRVARQDQAFFSGEYTDHLSKWMEAESLTFLRRVFPSSAVYGNLVYPDPDRPGGEAELDGLILWGPYEILIEAKGRQFRLGGRLEKPSHLRTDLKNNIHAAFLQGTRALRFIEHEETPEFKEKDSGRIARVRKDGGIKRFIVSVSLHHLGPVATQLAALQEVGLFSEGKYPWAVCLADLDIVTTFAGSPDVLVHYMLRRIEMQESGKKILGDELDLFGHYLDNRLHPSLYWERKADDGTEFDVLYVADGAVRFQQWKEFGMGFREVAPEIRLAVPDEVRAVLIELRRRDDDQTRFLAVNLLNFHPEDLDHLAAMFREQARVEFTSGHYPRITYKNDHDDVVVTIVAGKSVNPDEVRERVKVRSLIEKYRHRSDRAIGFGINRLDPYRPFDIAIYYEIPWSKNLEMEKLLENDQQRVLPGEKLPGRNDPCPCGSRLKFKKCCLSRFQ